MTREVSHHSHVCFSKSLTKKKKKTNQGFHNFLSFNQTVAMREKSYILVSLAIFGTLDWSGIDTFFYDRQQQIEHGGPGGKWSSIRLGSSCVRCPQGHFLLYINGKSKFPRLSPGLGPNGIKCIKGR